MTRFQEAKLIIKLWRLRWYLFIPLEFFYYTFFKEFRVYVDSFENDEIVFGEKYEVYKGKMLWKILKGQAQGRMRWYYTVDEIKKRINKKRRFYKK